MSNRTDALIADDALAQAAAIRGGVVSSVELLAETLNRIDRFDPRLRSYVAVDREGALLAAREADDRLKQVGPAGVPVFHGVPLSVKDVIDVAGLATTHSCKALADNVAAADAPLVRRFRTAGFIIVGKTNVPEFSSSMTVSEMNGVCRNPWDLDRTPGGSSGGAAAAVAARLCAIGHGTDGAGSTRVPASFCGLVGLKPSRQLVSFGPDEGEACYGTSEPGVLSRSVRDAAALLDVMVGRHSSEPVWSPRPADTYAHGLGRRVSRLKIALSTVPPFGAVSEECAQAAIDAATLLESLGHEVESATPDWGTILAAAALPPSIPGPAALVVPKQYGLLEPRDVPVINWLATMTVLEHDRLVQNARAAGKSFIRFWDSFDVLITPTCGMVPPDAEWAPWDLAPEDHMKLFAGFPNFAQPFNLSGQPAISLPLGWSDDGLPIGVQLAGRPLDETHLLALAAEIEQAAPWAHRVPPDPS
jgi:amidase